MTIYVDDALIPATVGRHTSRWCHLMSDQLDPAELHAFAARLGLRRSYFQPGRRITRFGPYPPQDHYDLTERKRLKAVRAGAIELDRAGLVALLTLRRDVWQDALRGADQHNEREGGDRS